MKRALFVIAIVILFSCEKTETEKEQQTCWICIDQYNTAKPPIETKIICDPVEAAYQNTKKHYKDNNGIWHDWTCVIK